MYYQIKNTEHDTNTTVIRLNAETFFIKIETETLGRVHVNVKQMFFILSFSFLVHDMESLIVSIGGYLGLFIGLSLNDVFSYLIDTGYKIISNVRKI